MFLAVTGYKGSGKDTFAQALLGNNNTSWLIYGNKPWLSPKDMLLNDMTLNDMTLNNMTLNNMTLNNMTLNNMTLNDILGTCSLAQPIKTIVHNHINIPYSEENKNMVVPLGGTIPYINRQSKTTSASDGISSDGMTIRQLYIAVAEEAKKDNPYIWVEALMATNSPYLYRIVTDVRFPCELERLQCPSIRIYRSLEDKNTMPGDMTETSLDHHQCDYFAVTSELEASSLITKFPQYTGYTLVGNIGK